MTDLLVPKTSTTDINIAAVGTGLITSSFVHAVSRVPGIRVAAVYSRDPERAATKAAEYGVDWSTSSWPDLLASANVDAVYIASPNSEHRNQIAEALNAGKHVLVEKPAVLQASDWRFLVDRADAAGLVLLEAMRTRYDPGTLLVDSLLPQLGTIRTASFRYQKRSARYDDVLSGRAVNIFDPRLGGGALMDLGVYVLHAMLTFFGTPEDISCSLVKVAGKVDGAGTVLAHYENLVVDASFSKVTTSLLPSEIQGEQATMTIDHIASPRKVVITHSSGAQTTHTLADEQHALIGEVARFVELLTTGTDGLDADQRATYETLQLMDSIRNIVSA